MRDEKPEAEAMYIAVRAAIAELQDERVRRGLTGDELAEYERLCEEERHLYAVLRHPSAGLGRHLQVVK